MEGRFIPVTERVLKNMKVHSGTQFVTEIFDTIFSVMDEEFENFFTDNGLFDGTEIFVLLPDEVDTIEMLRNVLTADQEKDGNTVRINFREGTVIETPLLQQLDDFLKEDWQMMLFFYDRNPKDNTVIRFAQIIYKSTREYIKISHDDGGKFYMNFRMIIFVILENLKKFVHIPVKNDDEMDYLIEEIRGKLVEKLVEKEIIEKYIE